MFAKVKVCLQFQGNQRRTAPLLSCIHTETFRDEVPEMTPGLPILLASTTPETAAADAGSRAALLPAFALLLLNFTEMFLKVSIETNGKPGSTQQ